MDPKPRTTRQRTAIAELLDEQDSFLSAQQLHALLVARGAGVGLTTVYRTLTAMAETHDVDAIRNPDGELTYRSCGSKPVGHHHHHLVCRNCGKAAVVEDDFIEKFVHSVGDKYGYTDVSHDIEFFGLCAECSAQ